MGIYNHFNTEKKAYIANPYADTYYKNMETIDAMWAVLRNLYSEDQAGVFERTCRKNIAEYRDMYAFDVEHKQEPPHHAPCCVRLAMLYEKQGRYKDAVDLCAFSIRIGAYEDGTKGKMYGRLARLIRKSGIDVSPDILKLTEAQ